MLLGPRPEQTSCRRQTAERGAPPPSLPRADGNREELLLVAPRPALLTMGV
ncbi:MAG TPA: hypothetical protein VF026_28110 [Ktedonobacteraceae bacterium]